MCELMIKRTPGPVCEQLAKITPGEIPSSKPSRLMRNNRPKSRLVSFNQMYKMNSVETGTVLGRVKMSKS